MLQKKVTQFDDMNLNQDIAEALRIAEHGK